MRHKGTFPIDDLAFWKRQLLHWTAAHELGVYLDSNRPETDPATLSPSSLFEPWECLAAVDAMVWIEAKTGAAFDQLVSFQKDNGDDWLFGFFTYDLKNELEALSSQNLDGIGLPDLGFFKPRTVASIKSHRSLAPFKISYWLDIETFGRSPEEVFEEIQAVKFKKTEQQKEKVVLQPRIPKTEYLHIVEAIRQHIAGGDIYELNFCQEFYAEKANLQPVSVFERLNAIGKAPFSSFMRWQDHYLLSASPERFLKKEGQRLLTQPIKGTRRRGRTRTEDDQIRQELAESEKDRSENVMIVDLVRNDFSRNCIPGSVRVEELCGIYSFATVHQMISTVSGQLPEHVYPIHALRDCFPMGSMTGAPKVMSMELIEHYERSRRGLYSGALGYFAPNGDFDFNVVIRSILYNGVTGYVSAQVGGAIVYDSVPEQEYEECLVKVEAMMRALG